MARSDAKIPFVGRRRKMPIPSVSVSRTTAHRGMKLRTVAELHSAAGSMEVWLDPFGPA
jgi:hypothetical protein